MKLFMLMISISVIISVILTSKFDRKYMSETSVILGVKIIRSGDNISLFQVYYVENFLRSFATMNLNK